MQMTATRETPAKRRAMHWRVAAKAIVGTALLITWSASAATGFLLWLAPDVRGAGQIPLIFEITKHQWGEIHFWINVAAISVTLLHLFIDWRVLWGCIKTLVAARRID